MIKALTLLVAKGLIAFLPISLTLYFLYWLVTSLEVFMSPVIPEPFYFPGLGLLTGLLVLLLLGIAVNAYFVRVAIRWGGKFFENIPVIKTIYGSINDAVNLINLGKQQKMQSVVGVQITESIELIGFITNETGAKQLFDNSDKLGVYIPLSYQIGGYTLYIDKDKVTPLDIDVETAMRIALTGGTVNSADNS